jgi:hypothetical protein
MNEQMKGGFSGLLIVSPIFPAQKDVKDTKASLTCLYSYLFSKDICVTFSEIKGIFLLTSKQLVPIDSHRTMGHLCL